MNRRPSRKAPLRPAPLAPVPDMVTAYRWAWYLLSFLVPFSGILIALFLYDRDDREVRKVGRNCLLIGFLVWVILPLLLGFVLLVIGILSMAGWISDLVDTTD